MNDSDQPRTLDAWLDYAERSHPLNIDMGLDRVRQVAEKMGLLDTGDTRSIIVAGTNGKGSTTTAIAALLVQAGLSTGATLSPHVHRFNERVQINGEELDDQSLCEAFASVDAARGGIPLTYFEFSALVALESFRRAAVDVMVLEVGLGGRLDAFNIIAADIAVVTSIGLDHQDFLGDDIEQIGREKAGVFRAGQQVVLGDVTASVEEAAAALNCPMLQLGLDFIVSEGTASWQFDGLGLSFEALPRGALAPTNLALAICAVSHLIPLERSSIESVIRAVRLPGRMERWRLHGQLIVLDVAHNPAGAEFLAAALNRVYPGWEFVGVLGMLTGKRPAEVVAALPEVKRWYLVDTHGSRGRGAGELQSALSGDTDASICEDLPTALQLALSSLSQHTGILIAGSFSVVEQARNWLLKSPQAIPEDGAYTDSAGATLPGSRS